MPAARLSARFETKAGEGSGAGYERWRSYEWRPHTSRREKEDVYVAHHRLLALLSFPEDTSIAECLAELDGCDVHHKNGVKWDNRLENLEVLPHGRHSSVTQSQMRAWGADAQQAASEAATVERHTGDCCPRCEDAEATLVESPAHDERLCVECSMQVQRGATASQSQ